MDYDFALEILWISKADLFTAWIVVLVLDVDVHPCYSKTTRNILGVFSITRHCIAFSESISTLYSTTGLISVPLCYCGEHFLGHNFSELPCPLSFTFDVSPPAWQLWKLASCAVRTLIGLNSADKVAHPSCKSVRQASGAICDSFASFNYIVVRLALFSWNYSHSVRLFHECGFGLNRSGPITGRTLVLWQFRSILCCRWMCLSLFNLPLRLTLIPER